MVIPSKEEFIELVKHGRIPPLYLEIPYLSPCLAYESLASPNSLLLESVKGPQNIARYSFIGFDPYLIFKAKNGVVKIEYSGTNTEFSNKPLSLLKNLIGVYQQIPFDYLPPFQGGMVGVFSYDFVQYLVRMSENALDDLNLPDAHFLMVDKHCLDHLTRNAGLSYVRARDSLNGLAFAGRTDCSENMTRPLIQSKRY
jgi:anthranilate/para-aminobenzoate synthase component I